MNLFTLTFTALGRIHIVSSSYKDLHNALFLLYSPIPLVSFSSDSVHVTLHPPQNKSILPPHSKQKRPSEPHLIANLRCYFADFPYLLSSTWPKASNLGDLLRSLVRSIMNHHHQRSPPGSALHPSLCFSRFNRGLATPAPKLAPPFSTYALPSN